LARFPDFLNLILADTDLAAEPLEFDQSVLFAIARNRDSPAVV
jgi:hypothetical protein